MRRGTRTEGTDAHTALLGSTLGQTFVAIVVCVMSVWIVGPNMPASPVRDTVDIVWSPAIQAGFDQNWEVFSPNPRDQAIEVVAILEFEDGTTAHWSVPEFDPLTGSLRNYRWRKWQERVRLDRNERYWESSAAWIADHHGLNDREASTVRLVRRWTVLAPLTGDGVLNNSRNEFEFYVWTR